MKQHLYCSQHDHRRQLVTIFLLLFIFLSLTGLTTASAQSASLVISQIYGGGGNSGATLHSDFIEILNRGDQPVNLAGFSVQYASGTGSTWKVTPLGPMTIPPGGYLLIEQASGSSGSNEGTPLAFPDLVGDIALSASSGKVALAANEEPIQGIDDPNVIDFVSYGSANEAEGGTPGEGLSASTALLRLNGGCTDTDQNGVDFVKGDPAPRNRASAAVNCGLTTVPPTPELPTATPTALEQPTEQPTEIVYPSPTATFTPAVLLTVTLTVTSTVVPTLVPTDTPEPINTAEPVLTDLPTDLPTDFPTFTPVPTAMIEPTATNPGEIVASPTSTSLPAVTSEPVETATPPVEPTATYPIISTVVFTATLLPATPATIATVPTVATMPTVPTLSTVATLPTVPSQLSSTPTTELRPTESATIEPTSTGTSLPVQVAPTLIPPTSVPPTVDAPLPTALNPTPLPQLWITEVMMNPDVVSDSDGEWIELYNPNLFPVDLVGWTLADAGSEHHLIVGPLVIAPGTYVVLARNIDNTVNGNVLAAYQYSNMQLGNSADELWLLAPDGTVVDRVAWHKELTIQLPTGATLERVTLGDPFSWQVATEPWPGTMGDFGSPNAGLISMNPATVTPAPMLPQEASATPTVPGEAAVGDVPNTQGTLLLPPTVTVPQNDATVTPITPGSNSPANDSATPVSTANPTETIGNEPIPTQADGSELTAPPDTETLVPTPLPVLIFSEVMVDPKAVNDSVGEYFELWLLSDEPVNLKGWSIGDLGTESHLIEVDLWVTPGEALLLGRNGDPTQNGGMVVDYIYSGISMANGGDELILYSPTGIEVDRVVWGEEVGLLAEAGVALERIDLVPGGRWAVATSAWPGTTGDLGSPGTINEIALVAGVSSTLNHTFVPLVMANAVDNFVAQSDSASPNPTATTVSTRTPTAMPTPSRTPVQSGATQTQPTVQPSVTPTATSLTSGSVAPSAAGSTAGIFLSEVMANPKAASDSSGEYIEICNQSVSATNLRGWVLADQGSERHEISQDLWVPASGCVTLGRNADVNQNGGVPLNYIYTSISLANTTDELLLISPAGQEVDRVLWHPESDTFVTAGASLERAVSGSTRLWRTAQMPWNGSAGDAGSPGVITVAVAAVPTSTPQSENALVVATATATLQPTDGAALPVPTTVTPPSGTLTLAAPQPTVVSATAPVQAASLAAPVSPSQLVESAAMPATSVGQNLANSGAPFGTGIRISEFLADSQAVADQAGEWIELANLGHEVINLNGWTLSDTGSERHEIEDDLLIEPGQVLLLARQVDSLNNGGIRPDYIYTGFNLANGADEILLSNPQAQLMDQVQWGDEQLAKIKAGASLERVVEHGATRWRNTESPWSASAGDFGTPGVMHPSLMMVDMAGIANGINDVDSQSSFNIADADVTVLSAKALIQETVEVESGDILSTGPAMVGMVAPRQSTDTAFSPLSLSSAPSSLKSAAEAGSKPDDQSIGKIAQMGKYLQLLSHQIQRTRDQVPPMNSSIPTSAPQKATEITRLSVAGESVIMPVESIPDLQVCLNDPSHQSSIGEGQNLLCGRVGLLGGETTLFLGPSVQPQLIQPGRSAFEPMVIGGFYQRFEGYLMVIALMFVGMMIINVILVTTLGNRKG